MENSVTEVIGVQIQVNKNLDEYKDDFYKGLTMKQTVLSVLTVAAGTGVFLFWHGVCGINQTVSLYLSFPAAVPFAASGFLKIYGMSLREYFRRKRSIAQQSAYWFEPALVKVSGNEKQKEELKAGKKSEKQPVLETREEMAARIRMDYEETNAGL